MGKGWLQIASALTVVVGMLVLCIGGNEVYWLAYAGLGIMVAGVGLLVLASRGNKKEVDDGKEN